MLTQNPVKYLILPPLAAQKAVKSCYQSGCELGASCHSEQSVMMRHSSQHIVHLF